MRWAIGLFVGVAMLTVTDAESRAESILTVGSLIDGEQLIELSSPGLVTVYVIVQSYYGMRGVKFSAPPPDCSGLVFLNASPEFPATTGSLESGMSVDFGQCRTGTILVLTVTFWNAGVDTCCPWGIYPDPSSLSGEIEGFRCDSSVVAVQGEFCTFAPSGRTDCGYPTMPSNPSPPNEAVDQPLSVTLDWDSQPTAGTGCGVFFNNVQFGLTTEAPIVFWNIEPPQTASALLPDTTYYWRVTSIVTCYGNTVGPWWSFRTEKATSVHKSTWGAIKALYRD